MTVGFSTKAHWSAGLALAAASAAFTQGDSAGIDFRTTGYFMTDGGYISETQDVEPKTWKNEYFYSFTGGVRMLARPQERLLLVVNPEMKSHNIFPITPSVQLGQTAQRMRYELYLEEAKGVWSFGNAENPAFRLGFGYMAYVDNPDTKVLGNYIFRSMIYPSLPFTKMDNTAAYLFGVHGALSHLDGALRNNLFVLSEVEHYPYFDLSVAWSGSFNFRDIVEVGAGAYWRSAVPVRPSRTTPAGGEGQGIVDNTYKFVPYQTSTEIRNDSGRVIKWVSVQPTGPGQATVTVATPNAADPALRDTTLVEVVEDKGGGIAGMSREPLNNIAMKELTRDNGRGELYPELNGVNTKYSFQGVTVGGRVSLNPLAMFGRQDLLGRDALKIYVEAAVLGWENYAGFYEKRSERTPIMFGVNLPTFNHLDFLSLEAEYYPSKQIPSYDQRSFYNIPQPGTHKGTILDEWDDARRGKDDWKWVVAAKRSFGGWGVVVQGGTDHTKLADVSNTAVFDVMSRPSQWYTQVRFVAGIR